MEAPATAEVKVFIGPGLSPFKRFVTIFGVILLLGVVLGIGVYQGILQGSSAVVSTILALLFGLGFVYYLRMIAPVPFTIELSQEALIKRSKRGEVVEIPWENLTRIKEEFFHNGKRIGISVLCKATSPEEKPKGWVVYRDDVTDLDALAAALKEAMPPTCEWLSKKVHD